MASTLAAVASHLSSDGLQPNSDGLQPNNSDASNLLAMASKLWNDSLKQLHVFLAGEWKTHFQVGISR